MEFISIVFVLIGLAAGYLIAHFRSGSRLSRLEERNENLSQHLAQNEHELKQAEQQAGEAREERTRWETEHKHLMERLSEQKMEMEKLQEQFKTEFKNLANEILEEKSKKFTEQNKRQLDLLLDPLGKKLEEFKKRVEDTHKEDIKGRSALEQHLKNLHDLNKQMSKEANDLTKALKGETKTQGSWGEVILQRILEKSGLTEGREYETQVAHHTEDGRRPRPDVVVHLPDEKRLIIDSKVSLKHYEQFVSAENDADRASSLKQHVSSLRAHVKNLGSKNYQQLYGGHSPDFVLMFVPIESAFGIALQKDTDLYYEAFEKNIVIVSPSTLLATLATIDSVWKQEYQNKNAMEIARRGGALYDKFVGFVESMGDIGQRIRQTQDSYVEAMSRLSTGQGSLVRQVEMLRDLGAKASKQLPGDMTEPVEGSEEEPVDEG